MAREGGGQAAGVREAEERVGQEADVEGKRQVGPGGGVCVCVCVCVCVYEVFNDEEAAPRPFPRLPHHPPPSSWDDAALRRPAR